MGWGTELSHVQVFCYCDAEFNLEVCWGLRNAMLVALFQLPAAK